MKRKNNRQGLILIAFLFVTLSLIMAGAAWQRHSKKYADIRGLWVEQEVAPYLADSFEIQKNGVYINGRQVTTYYQWDGDELAFCQADDCYLFVYSGGVFSRQLPAHYVSKFKLVSRD